MSGHQESVQSGSEPLPDFLELFNKTYIAMGTLAAFPTDYSWIDLVWQNFKVQDILHVITIAIFLTILRYFVDTSISKRLAIYWNLKPNDVNKMPESLWKMFAYLGLWTPCLYFTIFSGRHNFFFSPCEIWRNVVFDKNYFDRYQIPLEFQLIYWAQIGFYIHSVYATVYMDTWRKDSITMLIHHIVTILLLSMSYMVRYYKIGMMVLLLHDVSDVILEFTKIIVYLQRREGGGFAKKIYAFISSLGFLAFSSSWAYCRLYLFPLKVFYSTTWCIFIHMQDRAPWFYEPCFVLLALLLVMNIWWFTFIIILLVKIATGQAREIEDTREYDNNAREGTQTASSSSSSAAAVPAVSKEKQL